MGVFMKEDGWMIKLMEKDCTYIEREPFIKANGLMISNLAMGYNMIKKVHCMLENSKKDKKMDEELYISIMVNSIMKDCLVKML
jgi:hypothetical protein